MNQQEQLQLNENDKVYMLCLQGGMGARIIQTSFIRSLIQKRKLDGNDKSPILVVDNTLIGMMVSEALKNQNIHGIQVQESPNSWPHHPNMWAQPDGTVEHPIFNDSWRDNFKTFVQGGSLFNLLNNNWERAYSIEYGFMLTKLINRSKHTNDKKSFIGYQYSKTMGLEYDGGVPMLKKTQHSKEIDTHIKGLRKPFILLHLGVDLNNQDFMSPINYRLHKPWSLKRWAELVQSLKDKYNFVQVYANEHNPQIPDVFSLRVDNLNPVLQMLESPKCKFFMSIDNYLPHLASSIKKPGIVLWGSVSPYVWGWSRMFHKVPHIHLWNRHSCDNIACWRPNMFDTDGNGRIWICDKGYSCMKSISVDQVMKAVGKIERDTTADQQSKTMTI